MKLDKSVGGVKHMLMNFNISVNWDCLSGTEMLYSHMSISENNT